MKSKNAPRWVKILLISSVILLILTGGARIAYADLFSPTPAQECSQPPPFYRLLTNQLAHTNDGKPILVVRAVVGSGEGQLLEGSISYPFPDCHSEDPELRKVVDLDVTLDETGEEIHLLVGIVGGYQLPFQELGPAESPESR